MVNFSFTQNTGTARTAHVTVLGQPITVTQAAPQVGEVIWTGDGVPNTVWTDADNWGHTTVVAGDSLRFAGAKSLTNTNDFTAGTQFNGISFDAGAGAFTLNGNKINLGGNIVNNGATTQTINLPLTLTADRTLNAATAAGNLIIGGNISNNAGDRYGIVVVGPRSVTLAGVNTYAGPTTVSSGTLIVSNSNALPNGADLNIGAGSTTAFGAPVVAARAVAAALTLVSADSAGSMFGTTVDSSGGMQASTAARRVATYGNNRFVGLAPAGKAGVGDSHSPSWHKPGSYLPATAGLAGSRCSDCAEKCDQCGLACRRKFLVVGQSGPQEGAFDSGVGSVAGPV